MTETNKVPIQSVNRENWMKTIPGSCKLLDLRIPGTHDSGAYHSSNSFTGWVNCQRQNILNQLYEGIRCLDIRVGDKGNIYHDFVSLKKNSNENLSLLDVVDDCIKFLECNKSETILFTIKNENNIDDFEAVCSPAFQGERENFWFEPKGNEREITLGDVRGKMLLINRNNTGKKGLNWNDFAIQDQYEIGDLTGSTTKKVAELKYNVILEFNENIWKNEGGTREVFCFNGWNRRASNASPVFGMGTVEDYSNYINGWIANDLGKRVINYPRGIQSMDFYNLKNVDNIIASNYSDVLPDCTYEFTVKTKDISTAGTDSGIFFKLIGENGETEKFRANDIISGNAFERGKTDVFQTIFSDIGKITNMEINSEMSYAAAGWYPESTKIVKKSLMKSNEIKEFDMNFWVEDKAIHTFPRISYKFIVKTGTRTNAGTDSNIYFTLYGNKGKTNEFRTNSYISGNAHEKGNVENFSLGLPDIGKISKIVVRSDMKNVAAGWDLSSIEVSSSTDKAIFIIDEWIDKTTSYTFFPRGK